MLVLTAERRTVWIKRPAAAERGVVLPVPRAIAAQRRTRKDRIRSGDSIKTAPAMTKRVDERDGGTKVSLDEGIDHQEGVEGGGVRALEIETEIEVETEKETEIASEGGVPVAPEVTENTREEAQVAPGTGPVAAGGTETDGVAEAAEAVEVQVLSRRRVR